jgi:hypothetical protein
VSDEFRMRGHYSYRPLNREEIKQREIAGVFEDFGPSESLPEQPGIVVESPPDTLMLILAELKTTNLRLLAVNSLLHLIADRVK